MSVSLNERMVFRHSLEGMTDKSLRTAKMKTIHNNNYLLDVYVAMKLTGEFEYHITLSKLFNAYAFY
jgi:hypothetical protein